MEQGSPEWVKIRLGKPTASAADKLLTPSTRKPSASAKGYRVHLLTEWLLGCPIDDGSTGWMDRGLHMEAEAAAWYELQHDVSLQKVGFCERDDGLVGCSPDRLAGDDGLVEIKCLSAHNHVRAMLGEDYEHFGQVQFQMYVTGRAWCDILHYNPVLPPIVTRVPRDESYLDPMVKLLDAFVGVLEKDKERLAQYRRLSES